MLYRIYPTKDTFLADNEGDVVASASNMGASEILNLYRTSSGTASVLLAFNTASFPVTGTSLHLHLTDAQHDDTLPWGYTAAIRPLEQDWTEGRGQDIDFYTDMGVSNWNSSSLTSSWGAPGAFPSGPFSSTFYFDSGHEDIDVDVTSLFAPFGYHVSVQSSGADFYIKKFHSRQSHFPSRRPYLEARWLDWTGTLSTTSSFLATIGPWSGSYIDPMFSGTLSGALVNVTQTLADPTGALYVSIPNLRDTYQSNEMVTLNVSVRPRLWSPPVYTTASSEAPAAALLDAYYRVVDVTSEDELVPFGTGAIPYTKMSYNDDGNYFSFYMGSLPPGSLCRFDIMYQISGTWTMLIGSDFKFRVR